MAGLAAASNGEGTVTRYSLRWIGAYLYEVAAAASLLVNAIGINLFRDKPLRETLCGGCGRSMTTGGWALRVPWPRWFIVHCLGERDA